MEGLNFLHINSCHLDIKPENIMINLRDNSFKIIDFGLVLSNHLMIMFLD